MRNIQHTQIEGTNSETHRLNIADIKKQLMMVYSRENMAVNSRNLSAAEVLNIRDSLIIADTSGGSFQLTLQYANSWGGNKSPVIAIIKEDITNVLTVIPSGADTIKVFNGGSIFGYNSGAPYTISSGLLLMSDGVDTWWVLSEIDLAGAPTNINVSAGTTSNNLTQLVFFNGNGVTFGLTGSTITASVAAAAALTNIKISAGTSSTNLSALTFSNSNNVSFGLSGSVITGSAPNPGMASITANAGTDTIVGDTLVFHNGYGISFGTVNSLGTDGIFISHNGLTSQSNQAVSGSNGSFAFQTVTFGNLNGLSFYTSNGSIVASHNALTTARASNDAVGLNTAQTNVTWTVNSGGISLNAAGYAGTGTSATNASITLNSNGLAISVAAPGGGAAVTVSASNGSFTVGQLNFSNANNVTFGTSAGSIVTASVAAPGGGAGNTMSMWPYYAMPIAVSSVYSGASTTTAGGSRTSVSLYVCPIIVDDVISFNKVFGYMSMNTTAGTGSVTMGNAYGLYTLNGASLSLLTSWGMGMQLSQNSISARTQHWYYGTNSAANSSSLSGNVSASFARLNQVLYDNSAQTIPAGQYWLVHGHTQRSSGLAAALFSYFPVSESQSTGGSMFGTNVSSRMYGLIGIGSTVTSNTRANNVGDILPPFIETSGITGTGGSSQNRSLVVYLQSQ